MKELNIIPPCVIIRCHETGVTWSHYKARNHKLHINIYASDTNL